MTLWPDEEKKGKLKSPLIPVVKKLNNDWTAAPVVEDIPKPVMVNIGTDTILTPN